MKKLIFCLALALVMSVSFACSAWADELIDQTLMMRTEKGLEEITDKTPIWFYPAVYADGFKFETKTAYPYGGTEDVVFLWSETDIRGALDKLVFVKNVTKNTEQTVYFRTVIAFPDAGNFHNNVHVNYNTEQYRAVWLEEDITIDGAPYKVLVMTYQGALAAGKTAPPSLLQIALDKSTDNEDLAALGGQYDLRIVTEAQTEVDTWDTITSTNNPWTPNANIQGN